MVDDRPVVGAANLVYSSEDQLFRTIKPLEAAQWVLARLRHNPPLRGAVAIGNRGMSSSCAGGWPRGGLEAKSPDGSTEFEVVQPITIRFLTPTFLRAAGEIIRRPEFHHIFKRLRDRINALHTFFGDGPLDIDFRRLGERAERVRRVSANFQWVDRFRTSSKTGQRHEISGFIGDATYEGEITEFLPWLVLGELLHVGRHAAWGNGWYQLIHP